MTFLVWIPAIFLLFLLLWALLVVNKMLRENTTQENSRSNQDPPDPCADEVPTFFSQRAQPDAACSEQTPN
jgi:hypothetical protein